MNHIQLNTFYITLLEREREREMASRIQKRMALRRKLHILRNLTKSKSVIILTMHFY